MTENQSHPTSRLPALHMIYASAGLPLSNKETLRISYSTGDPGFETLSPTWTRRDAHSCLGQVAFEQHNLQIAGLSVPLPRDLIDQTVMVSPWPAQTKAAMRQHQSFIQLTYTGTHPDPAEQMIALYSLAAAFESEDLLGIVNANAWTAHPPADFLSPERIAQYRLKIPFNLWFGYVRFYIDDQSYWLVTKGHHIFDVPDLAYFVLPGENPEGVINLLINVFYYLYEQDTVVAAGDTLEISGLGQTLHFSEVTELSDVLMGPAGTLVLEKDAPTL
jgi:hypothetical protein